MKIVDVLLCKGTTGFYFDDQRAIKAGAEQDQFIYKGSPITPGFTAIRQAGEAILIQIILSDGQVATGDCAAVQYSGAGGRDPVFLADAFIPFIEEHVKPLLIGQELWNFRKLAEKIDRLKVDGKRIHTAIRYGVTQALLDAVAKANYMTIAEVIQEEYEIVAPIKRVPIFGQSGDDRYVNVDKMIMKETDVLPHGLINHVETKLGKNGELLREYVEWLRDRILKYRIREDYEPILHIDVYGTIGLIFDNDIRKIAEYLKDLGRLADPFKLRIEGPLDVENREGQIKALSELTRIIDDERMGVEIVADEWCNTLEDIKDFVRAGAGHVIQIKTPDLGGVNNTVEALLFCRKHGVGAYSGGTCNETNRSAEITTQIAMACGATQVLAKPGMGFDEGYMIVNNEMNRVLTLLAFQGMGEMIE